jgi:hypothetical protein
MFGQRLFDGDHALQSSNLFDLYSLCSFASCSTSKFPSPLRSLLTLIDARLARSHSSMGVGC